MFSRPSLTALVQRVRADVLSRQTGADQLRRSDAEVQARVLAGAAHGLYGFIEWVFKQILPDTADEENLERHASFRGVSRKTASAATGTASFVVQAGASIPSGTLLQALDGTQFQTAALATIAGLSATAPVVAVVPGASGNRDVGESLGLVSPLPGVSSTATVVAISGGADTELDDALRSRLLARIQQPPQGGAKGDYEAWALEVAGVTRAWEYPGELGPGTITVRFVRDNDGVGAAIIPDAGEVATVQAYMEQPGKRPVTAQLTVVAPIASPLNFTFTALSPDSSAIRAAIQAELQDLLIREAKPGGTVLLSHIRAAISVASGEDDFTLTAPAANVVSATGYLSTMGAITWPT